MGGIWATQAEVLATPRTSKPVAYAVGNHITVLHLTAEGGTGAGHSAWLAGSGGSVSVKLDLQETFAKGGQCKFV